MVCKGPQAWRNCKLSINSGLQKSSLTEIPPTWCSPGGLSAPCRLLTISLSFTLLLADLYLLHFNLLITITKWQLASIRKSAILITCNDKFAFVQTITIMALFISSFFQRSMQLIVVHQ